MRVGIALLLCASVAGSPPPWMQKIEELVCQQMKKGSNEEVAVAFACGEITKEVNVPEAKCEKIGKAAYEAAEKRCPPAASAILPPWAKEIEQLLCQKMKANGSEQEVITTVCKDLKKEYGSIPEAECEMIGKMAWDNAEKKCPSQGVAAVSLPPWMKRIEEYVCLEMLKGDNEQHAVASACGEISKEINVTEKKCEMVGKKVYEAVETKCAKHVLAANSLPPWAQKLEHLLCEQMKKGSNEQHSAEIVCREIRKEISVPERMCEILAKRAYKAAEKKCPSQTLSADNLPPWMQRLERVLCEQMMKDANEQRAVKIACAELRKRVGNLPESMCEMMAKKAYKAAEKKCPSLGIASTIVV